jgi:hypothetical protein
MLAELLTCLNEHDQQAEKNRWQTFTLRRFKSTQVTA